ncbi:MAG: sodium ion-translocating decarboxylase subunit beta [Chloroflexota bacterium]|jgi:oxaloacetate decarboxylase beta subunit|uniref:Glutaconyl-CoA decarboxylase subunit beta n=1 Tax=marine metagenome TaxID=408172 RepID=A0A381QQR4_9ZZZZ|nr:sodium ion-translocating decarboxylase subunit beta [Chloroflexota bacterium]|tara:strand:- start:16360 stop:17526 length:1167 start_codon:yes stop_codon:yes gene_type:complete
MEQLLDFIRTTGLANLGWRDVVMIFVGIIFIYLAIKKDWEPYELLPIGLGIIAANLPLTGLITPPTSDSLNQEAGIFGIFFHYGLSFWNILPPIIFLGIGSLTDFGPVIANPKTLLLGAAAQIGIFVAFWGALMAGSLGILGMDFGIEEAASIGIIGGADGPTTIFLSARLAPEILGITAVIAYSYMAAVAFIQPPLMKMFTTEKERQIVMRPLREVSKLEKLIFPNVALIAIILMVPKSAPLIAMFMIGNLFRESGVVPRLTKSASNEILNIATIFLMITVGTQLTAARVFDWQTMVILILGLVAFSCGTIGGILFAKIMNLFLNEKINPLIGSAGVSAVPMAARISHHIGQEANPNNFLLPHAMGPNVAGVIGSAVIAGVFISLVP